MGQVPKAETERNAKLIADYMTRDDSGRWKYTIPQLSLKYARKENGEVIPLSSARIHQILSKNGIPKNRVVKKKK